MLVATYGIPGCERAGHTGRLPEDVEIARRIARNRDPDLVFAGPAAVLPGRAHLESQRRSLRDHSDVEPQGIPRVRRGRLILDEPSRRSTPVR